MTLAQNAQRVRVLAEPALVRLRPLLVRAQKVTAPYLTTVTALGWCLAGIAVLSWLLGQWLGWYELIVLALCAAACVVLAIPFILGRTAYAVRLDLARDRVVVGERATGALYVRNSSSRSLLPAQIELPVGLAVARFRVPRLGGGEEHEEIFTIPTARRAVLTAGPVRSVRGDALGIMRRIVRWSEPTDLFVHPRTVSLDGASSGFLKDIEGEATKELSNSDVSFHALRDYAPGDDRRHIHWNSSARLGRLMVRQFEETRRSHLAVALACASGDFVDDESYELAVSVAGSIGGQAIREQRQITVLTPRGALRVATGKQLLDDLSGVSMNDSDVSIVELTQTLTRLVPNASVVMLVVGAGVRAGQLRSAAAAVPLGVRVVAVRCEPGREPVRRALGDLIVLTVGKLTELPRTMRRINA